MQRPELLAPQAGQVRKLPGKEIMLNFCRRILASFPMTKIALIPFLIADVSISSIGATVVLMLLHSFASVGKGQWFSPAPSGEIVPAAGVPLL
jgi:hypothetical protein